MTLLGEVEGNLPEFCLDEGPVSGLREYRMVIRFKDHCGVVGR